MESFTDSPFAAFSIVVVPAVLTNASSIPCLGTANRLARVVDTTRIASEQLTHPELNVGARLMHQEQLEGLEARWNLTLRAIKLFYITLGSFAAAALISLFGSLYAPLAPHIGFPVIALLGLLSGTVGIAGLVLGCAPMAPGTRLAVRSLAEEAQILAQPAPYSRAKEKPCEQRSPISNQRLDSPHESPVAYECALAASSGCCSASKNAVEVQLA